MLICDEVIPLQNKSLGGAKNIIFFAALVIFMMWVLKPYLNNNTDIVPERYYELGVKCLNDFEKNTHKSNYKLTNTYAKKVSKSKDMVLIRAQDQLSNETLKVECIYSTSGLLFLSINERRIEL